MIDLAPPDLSAFQEGNTGTEWVTVLESGRPGPHVMVNALTHGNELCGAIALARLLDDDIRPACGRLTLSFANVQAFLRFDAGNPYASRYVDEDFNRLWRDDVLDSQRTSIELERARALRPFVVAADHLLDLHSMHLPGPPLVFAGMQEKSLDLARALAYPGHVVRDEGHRAGRRMRDYNAFDDPESPSTAMLVECGQHWAHHSVDVALAATLRFLDHFGMLQPGFLPAHLPPGERPNGQRVVEVSEPVTVRSRNFRFVEPYQGFQVIPQRGTLIAYDGAAAVRTPYDDCVLVMPTPGAAVPGSTAVRLGRYVQ